MRRPGERASSFWVQKPMNLYSLASPGVMSFAESFTLCRWKNSTTIAAFSWFSSRFSCVNTNASFHVGATPSPLTAAVTRRLLARVSERELQAWPLSASRERMGTVGSWTCRWGALRRQCAGWGMGPGLGADGAGDAREVSLPSGAPGETVRWGGPGGGPLRW
jgi:hypothetical protein